MKTNKAIVLSQLFVGLVAMLLASCQKDLPLYSGEEGVYFNVQRGAEWGDSTVWGSQSFTQIDFINLGNEDYHDVIVRVNVTGRFKDFDRPLTLIVDKDSTTADANVHYKLFPEKHVVKAHTGYVDIPVRIFKMPDLRKEEKVLGLRLLPNEHFTLGIPVWKNLPGMWKSDRGDGFDAGYHRISMNHFIVRPKEWYPTMDFKPGETERGLWGAFSEKKYLLIAEKFGLTYNDFMSPETMPMARKRVIQEYFVKYLQALYDAGTPVLEEDGRAMWFMGVSWNSVIGVKWQKK